MNEDRLAYHETVDLHEVLNFKTVCLMKSKMMQGLVLNQELSALMEKDVQYNIAAITELKELYSKSQIVH